MFHVYLVDDTDDLRQLAARFLRHRGYEIVGQANNGIGLIEKLVEVQPDVVVLDMEMPEIPGMDLIQPIVEAGFPVVVWTSGDLAAAAPRATELGAAEVVWKPEGMAALEGALQRVLGVPRSNGMGCA